MFRRLILILVAVATLAPPASAAEPSALERYHTEHLGLRLQLFGGLKVTRASEAVPLGFFGGGAEEIFDGSDAALAEMETFTTLRTAGTVLWATGLTILLTELVVLLVDEEVFLDTSSTGIGIKPLFWGLMGGGLALGLTGGFMIQYSSTNLSRAVEHYNDDLFERLRESSGTGAVSLRWRSSF